MNKPYTITFGLLLGSLVMIAPSAMPLVNLNIFSNAMAQGYYQDDNNYQSSYEDRKQYSKYPSKDNKVQCKKGPWEGFFVRSVEFCFKHADKDDDKRDGKQGPRGEKGEKGDTGDPGQQGPAGITQLNDANTYRVTSGPIVNTFDRSTTGSASCNDGDFVINGGFTITATSPSPAAVTLFENWNKPFYNPVTSGWEVFIWPTLGSGQSSGMVTYLVHATCFDNSP